MELTRTESGLLIPASLSQLKEPKRKLPTSGQIRDRYVNAISGFGDYGFDPQTDTRFYQEARLDQAELDALFKDSWLAKRSVEAIPRLATRKGFTIKAKKEEDQETALQIERIIKKWNRDDKLCEYGIQARLYGDAAKVYDFEDGFDSRYPIHWGRIRGIEKIHLVDRFSALPFRMYSNPVDQKRYKTPMLWKMILYKSAWGFETRLINEQRITWLEGAFLTPRLKAQNTGFSDSILQSISDTLRNHETSIQAIGGVIQDFVLKIVKIENFDELLDDEEGRDELNARLLDMDRMSNIHKTIAIGEREEYKKISTPIEGLVGLVSVLMDQVSAATGIPKSILFGNLTGTLGSASGYHDRATFCEIVEEYQNKKLTVSLEKELRLACFLEAAKSDDYQIIWRNIRDLGAKEDAETEYKRAQTLSISTAIAEKFQDANLKDLTYEIHKRIENIAV